MKLSEMIKMLEEKPFINLLRECPPLVALYRMGLKKEEIIKLLEEDLKKHGDLEVFFLPGELMVGTANFETATEFCKVFYERLFKEMKIEDNIVLWLDGENFTRRKFLEELPKVKPEVLELNGHGRYDVLTGYAYDEIIWYGDERGAKIIHDSGVKIMSVLSCETAKVLGKWMAEKGYVDYYRGYEEVYVFVAGSETPNPYDPFAEPFFISHLEFLNYLYNVEWDVEAAFEASTKKYIQYAHGDYPEIVRRYLLWDAQVHKLHEHKPPTPPPEGKYVCPFCEKAFNSLEELRKHYCWARRIKLFNIIFLKDEGAVWP